MAAGANQQHGLVSSAGAESASHGCVPQGAEPYSGADVTTAIAKGNSIATNASEGRIRFFLSSCHWGNSNVLLHPFFSHCHKNMFSMKANPRTSELLWGEGRRESSPRGVNEKEYWDTKPQETPVAIWFFLLLFVCFFKFLVFLNKSCSKIVSPADDPTSGK